jgi:hypothetical protein
MSKFKTLEMLINNKYFFFSIKKAKDCLFSRRNGLQGILLFGYSFYFIIKSIERRKADKRFNAEVIEPLAKKIQEEVDRQVIEELIKIAKKGK